MMFGAQHQQNAVKSGYWPLFRYNPMNEKGKRFTLDSKEPILPLKDFLYDETRFSILERQNPENARILLAEAENGAQEHLERLLALKAL
jgi:pyruvate-ferredoxin/flavodoxin oxidoreductase